MTARSIRVYGKSKYVIFTTFLKTNLFEWWKSFEGFLRVYLDIFCLMVYDGINIV